MLGGQAAAFVLGVAMQLRQAALWPLEGYAALLVFGLILGGFAARRRWPWKAEAIRFAAALTAAALLGFGITGWHAKVRLDESLAPALEGADVQLVGIVASLPQVNGSGTRFRFEVESATLHGEPVAVPARMAIGWYRNWNDEATLSDPTLGLRAGQRWRFTVRLRAPHGTLNPDGFDYELWLFEQGLRATGYVRATPRDVPALLEAGAGYGVERLRQHVRDAIYARVADARAAGVLAALSVGDQGAIERDDWDLFRNTGVAHLVSISGLHVTMFAWLAGLLIAAGWRRSRPCVLAVPTPIAARWGGVVAACAYAVFSGWGVPSQRTVWMLATVALLHSFSKRWPWPLVLSTAALVVSLLDPWALLQPGFWLSFFAVGLLMASAPAWPRQRADEIDLPAWHRRLLGRAGGVVREGLRTQLTATLGLAPLTLVFFQQLSLVGFLANLVAIPLVTLVITPLALLGVFVPPLWLFGAWVIERFAAFLGLLAGMPGAVWMVPVVPWWAQLSGLVAGALAIMPLPPAIRWLAVPLALPLCWPTVAVPEEGAFELLAADVGQGTAVFVRTRSHLLVYDSGPQYSPDSDAGQRVLVPLLQARGERRLDRLVLSHRDLDHVGGAASLMRAFPPTELWSSLEPGHRLLAAASSATRCAAGQSWRWDGVRFDVMRPLEDDYARSGLKPNALSCVLRVQGATHSALLTGDIEREQELQLVAAYGPALQSELLVVAHHGSKTSSTPAFIDAVQPRYAVFQAGYRNRFGHPAPEVVQRYVDRGIRVFASPRCGALAFDRAVAPGQINCERDVSRRYWHHALPGDP